MCRDHADYSTHLEPGEECKGGGSAFSFDRSVLQGGLQSRPRPSKPRRLLWLQRDLPLWQILDVEPPVLAPHATQALRLHSKVESL